MPRRACARQDFTRKALEDALTAHAGPEAVEAAKMLANDQLAEAFPDMFGDEEGEEEEPGDGDGDADAVAGKHDGFDGALSSTSSTSAASRVLGQG